MPLLAAKFSGLRNDEVNSIAAIVAAINGLGAKLDAISAAQVSQASALAQIATNTGYLLAISGALQAGEGVTVASLLEALGGTASDQLTKLEAIRILLAGQGQGEILLPTLLSILSATQGTRTALTANIPGTPFYELAQINWAIGGKPQDSLELTTVRGLLAANWNWLQRVASLIGEPDSPEGVCTPPFVSTGALRFNQPGLDETRATWSGYTPAGLELLAGGLGVRVLEGEWKAYVDSRASQFWRSSNSAERHPTNEWVPLPSDWLTGGDLVFAVEGGEHLTVYICGLGDTPTDPGGGGPEGENPQPTGYCTAVSSMRRCDGWIQIANDHPDYNIWRPYWISSWDNVICELVGDDQNPAQYVNVGPAGYANVCACWDFTGNTQPVRFGRDMVNNAEAAATSEYTTTGVTTFPLGAWSDELDRSASGPSEYQVLNFAFPKALTYPALNCWYGQSDYWPS